MWAATICRLRLALAAVLLFAAARAERDARPGGAEPPSGSVALQLKAPPTFEHAVLHLAPSADYEASLTELLRGFNSILRSVFGEEARAIPFGSILQSVYLEGSDLDLCFDVPGESIAVVEFNGGKQFDSTRQVVTLRKLAHVLERQQGRFRVIETRLWAGLKIPLIIVRYHSTTGFEIEADLSVGSIVSGVQRGLTDRCIRRLFARCPRALHLARVVKLWATVEKLNKAYEGFLNSLGWTCLVLYYCIERNFVDALAIYEEEPNERGPGGDTTAVPPLLHTAQSRGGDLTLEEQLLEVPTALEVADFFQWLASWTAWWPQAPPAPHKDPGSNAAMMVVWGLSLVDGNIIEVPPPTKTWIGNSDLFIEDPGARIGKGSSMNIASSLKAFNWAYTLERCADAAMLLRAGVSYVGGGPQAAQNMGGGGGGTVARLWLEGLLRRGAIEANSAHGGAQVPHSAP
mmetsp:Transcript_109598/g.316887  ORF Transcript_109598/g.316887 Transcript_109598/m.316887 type:complete len:460 (+) Transcript_109598:40-1419(+)